MQVIESIEALEEIYGDAVKASLTKVARQITPLYRQWIGASRFCVLSTVGPEGTDGTPRGDDGPVVLELDAQTLALPDWRGNNRIDSLRNIVRDGRVSLMFMVPGAANVVRVNGRAVVAVEPGLLARFEKAGKQPRSVVVVTVEEVYFQCAKAIMRSELWRGEDESGKVPSAGQMIREADAAFDAESYDDGYAEYAKPRMW
ncbi:pyridoxamine 5'-phosphate oxidase family protein [Vannielia litorea]|uniref:pyridoxamine 5'-phosphate oxidase family protein n=1 Tax=Vannielia litorea TaxID=1217970 RepID=UPI001BD16D9B|nr:pyridoxamine 5'-phosphate oxidase family protein [Vannielia litorea]MBS8226629.1 pyridoxamine 5'-phosphate oxidase family protein [Vannielia litorea]